MENYLLFNESEEVLGLSKNLGFSSCKFLGTIKADTQKKLLKEIATKKGIKRLCNLKLYVFSRPFKAT